MLRSGGGDQNLRTHLVAAAERLIARRGTVGLTVRDIAREAQVADGVLYNHFADKEELLVLALQAHVGAAEGRLLAGQPPPAGSGTVEQNLRDHLTVGLRLLAAVLPAFVGVLAQPGVLARLVRASDEVGTGGQALRAGLLDYLHAEQELGRVAADAHVQAAVTLLVGACHDLVLHHLMSGAPAGELRVPPGFVDELVATVVRGVAPAGGS